MASSGAIPKIKGGARPKTKSLANGNVQNGVTTKSNTNTFTLNPKNLPKIKELKNSPVEDFSISSSTNVSPTQPLDKREIHITDDGVEVKRPALSPEWVEKRIFIHYTRPPVEGEYVVGAVDAWVEQMEFLSSDLTWLLELPHYKFWSQIVFDKSVQECLQYYLMEGPRWYDTTILPKDEICLSLLNSIHQLVFLIFVRMATFKESKNDYITPSVFGDLIYDNFIYDICKILDLCILYGISNSPLLERLLSCVFTHQPKYYNDLSEFCLSLFSVLKNLEEKLGVSEGMLVPCSLASEESKISLEELGDIIEYMMDSFCSLQAFLTIFPKACETFHVKDFELRLSSFYERAVPKLVDHLSTDKDMQLEELAIKRELREKLDVVRLSILTIFREILNYICLSPKEDASDSDAKTLSEKIESFSHILTSSVEEKVFITDYNASYDLSADILYFKEKGADLTTLTFIKEAVESIVNEVSSSMVLEEGDEPSEEEEIAKKNEVPFGDTSGMNGYYAGQTNSLSPVEVESLVSGVQDLFPELGSGFIKECLRYYSFSGEEVLNAILEDNLPPCLDALDRSMKETMESSTSSSSRSLSEESSQNSLSQREKLTENLIENQEEHYECGTLSNRLNIYDDDEFDVFRKPASVRKEKIHKGKAAPSRNLYEKDPDLTQKMKNIVEQYEWSHGYSIYEDEEKYTSLAGLSTSEADYDDEYDDTYADNEAGDVDNFAADGRRFERIPTIRGRGALNTPSLNFFDEDDEEETQQEKSEFHNQEEMAEGVDEGKGKSPHSEGGNFKGEKFKRANASQRRVYAERGEEWNSSQSLSFTNSNRSRGGGGGGGSRRSVSFREDNQNTSDMNDLQQGERNSMRPSFEPFCENPEDTRRRMERRRLNKQFRNKGYQSSAPDVGSEDTSNNSAASYSQKTSTKTNKHSGKHWRQGGQESDDASGRRVHGGKYKEDTNHGKAQDKNFRHKMIHKNEQRRNAAQAKYRNNF
ncbi:UNVERIFIED_CONTAM: hypothetical protein RMT77_015308 [Armadillidium vulgare]